MSHAQNMKPVTLRRRVLGALSLGAVLLAGAASAILAGCSNDTPSNPKGITTTASNTNTTARSRG